MYFLLNIQWFPIPGIPVAPKIRHSRNHDLMRTVGFVTMLAAATWMKWGGELKHSQWIICDLCTESIPDPCPTSLTRPTQPIRCGTSDLEDFSCVLPPAAAGYSYRRRKQRDAGKIQGVMKHGGK